MLFLKLLQLWYSHGVYIHLFSNHTCLCVCVCVCARARRFSMDFVFLILCMCVCFQAQVAFLQGERKGQENMKQDLVRRIKMLEYALKQER